MARKHVRESGGNSCVTYVPDFRFDQLSLDVGDTREYERVTLLLN